MLERRFLEWYRRIDTDVVAATQDWKAWIGLSGLGIALILIAGEAPFLSDYFNLDTRLALLCFAPAPLAAFLYSAFLTKYTLPDMSTAIVIIAGSALVQFAVCSFVALSDGPGVGVFSALVVFTTEFGRMPTFQKGANGRDHNPKGFTVWMTGAGVKRGFSHGATDEFGYRAVEDVATIYDLHATILRLLGLEHEQLTFYHNGIERRLTDVHGRVIEAVLT